jgi:hypothetical protein
LDRVKAALEKNPNFIKSLEIRGADNKPIDLSIFRNGMVRVNFPDYGKNVVVNYISDWIKHAFGKAPKPSTYTTNHGLPPLAQVNNPHQVSQVHVEQNEEKVYNSWCIIM